MTMDRNALVERVAEAIYNERNRGLKNCWVWDDSGLDEEHPGTRAATMRLARAALAVIEPAVREECGRVARRVDECMALRATVAALQLDIAKVEADAKEFLAERDTLRATVAQLREALEDIAKQRLLHEMEPDERCGADWESGYSAIVEVARAALAAAKGAGE